MALLAMLAAPVKARVPAFTIVGPAKVLVPETANAPGPVKVKPNPPLIPPTLSVLARLVTTTLLLNTTELGLKLRLLPPAKVKLLRRTRLPLPSETTPAAPLVLSSIPPLIEKFLPAAKPLKALVDPAEAKLSVPLANAKPPV